MILPRRFLRRCRESRLSQKVADSTGAKLTGGTLLLRTLILRRLLGRVLAADEKNVGILLPPSAGGVLANAAVTLSGRVAVNLNYTASSETLNYCLREAGVRHVLTSHKFMEKVELDLDTKLVYLEDFKDRVTVVDKALSALDAYALPVGLLERKLGLTKLTGDDLFTIIFTSGSTGKPKGVMLSFNNVGSNVDAIDAVVHLTKDDTVCGVLPFFHSFGFTVTLWCVLALKVRGVYHFSPLDARQVGKLCHEHGATILILTPTFLRTYLRRCPPEEMTTLDVIVVGAEKLPVDLSDAVEEKFGVRPVEGYGTTELSPLVSVNIPPSRGDKSGLREGTVGRPIPGVTAKIVHPETGADMPTGESGLLLIKGPNVMRGYLNQPEATAKALRDGWYVTGDIAFLDPQGFIKITGRQSRFSKIGGEMVPHGVIEEHLQKIMGGDEQALSVAVTAVSDPRKGERIVVLYTCSDKTPEEANKALSAAGLPNLFIPSPDSYAQVEEIPVLGTGKLDLQQLKQLALERFAPAKSEAG